MEIGTDKLVGRLAFIGRTQIWRREDFAVVNLQKRLEGKVKQAVSQTANRKKMNRAISKWPLISSAVFLMQWRSPDGSIMTAIQKHQCVYVCVSTNSPPTLAYLVQRALQVAWGSMYRVLGGALMPSEKGNHRRGLFSCLRGTPAACLGRSKAAQTG